MGSNPTSTAEVAIREHFPRVYAERFPQWVEADARLLHGAQQLTVECSICRAIGRHARVNLEPPDAA